MIVDSGIRKVIFREIFVYFAITCFVCCASVIVLAAMSYATLNKQSELQSVSVVKSALKSEMSKSGSLCSSFAVWEQAYQNIVKTPNPEWIRENISNDLSRNFGVEFVGIISDPVSKKIDYYGPHGVLKEGVGTAAEWENLIKSYMNLSDHSKPFTTMHRFNNRLYMISTSTISSVGADNNINPSNHLLVVAHPITDQFLRNMSDVYFIENLRFVERVDPKLLPESRLALESTGRTEGYLTWTPPQTGFLILSKLFPLGIIILLFLGVIAVLILRHITKTAESYDNMLRELVVTTAELTKSKAEAESSNAAKSRFLSTMSHEIRTPMNGLVGMISLLKDTSLNQAQTSYINTMQMSADSLMNMLDSILEYSSLEAGTAQLNVSIINLHRLIKEVHGLLTPVAIQKKLKFELFFGEEVPTLIKSDPVRLRQVLLHLTTNALKFTEKGGVRINVMSLAKTSGVQEVTFQVIDTGIGIPENMLGTLFEDFFQVDSNINRKYDGAGLGLSIVQNVAHLMNAKVGVESKVGEGSLFWFTATVETPSPSEAARFGDKGQKLHREVVVLVVEDNALNQEMTCNMLAKIGAKSEKAQNVAEAVKILKIKRFDTILLRIGENKEEGVRDVQAIKKASDKQQNIPIVGLLSQNVVPEDFNGKEMGLDEIIPQPVTVRKILYAVDQLFDDGKILL